MNNLLRALRTGNALPNQVSLDEYVSTWFRCLWDLSRIPPVREHGAALVEVDGSLTVSTARPGQDMTFPLNKREMALDEFKGYYHTHPAEEGMTGDAFSAADFIVTIIYEKMKICMAQSGEDLFMLVKTPQTPKPKDPNKIWNEVKTQFYDRLKDYLNQGEVWQDALMFTNLDICREYGLAFYVGRRHEPLQRWL